MTVESTETCPYHSISDQAVALNRAGQGRGMVDSSKLMDSVSLMSYLVHNTWNLDGKCLLQILDLVILNYGQQVWVVKNLE